MNYITHLTGFFDRIIDDRNLNPTHVSLYIALFQFWNVNRFQNPISITRNEVMRISKISSKATYHKCMKDLNEKGYVKYEPSYNPFKGSMVILFDFTEHQTPVQKTANSSEKILSKMEQAVNKKRTTNETSSGTSTEQALVSSINNTNTINNSNFINVSNLEEQAKKIKMEDNYFKKNGNKKEKSSAKKEKPFAFDHDNQIEKGKQKEIVSNSSNSTKASAMNIKKPSHEQVKAYFLQENFPEVEANKFFNYFSSIGWLVGGKTPMVDWTAAAQNWMLNAIKFNPAQPPPDRAKHLNVENDKNYSEPL